MNRIQGDQNIDTRNDNRNDRKNSHMYSRTLSLDFPPPFENPDQWLLCNKRRTAFPFVITLKILYHVKADMARKNRTNVCASLA